MPKTRKYKGGDYTSNTQPTSSSSGILDFFTNAWNDTKKNTKGLFDNLMGKSSTPSTISSYSSTSTSSPNTSYSTNSLKSNYPIISSSTSVTNTPENMKRYAYGGKRSKRSKSRKGGKFAPVHNLSVAKPTYWIKGGKTKKRRNKKKRRSN